MLLALSSARAYRLLFCIPSGVLADKIPKKIILLATDVITILSLVLLVIITASQYFNFFLYVCMLVIIAIANEFRYTATTAFIPELASSDQLIRYNGLQQIFRGILVIAGPILGAVSYEMINIGCSLFLSMFIQLTSLLILLKIPSNTTTAAKTEQNQQGYYEAFYWLRSSKLLKVYLFSFCVINVICVSYMSIITPYILEAFDKKHWC
ncbi:MFS transporter [Moraxella cuniculi]|uniref:MFS transporter n=1 Tax=Moraxella cuniculi TaxID=34061 RepID=UPI000993E4D1|nr:MFS transporter [Moraxella cuniculi]